MLVTLLVVYFWAGASVLFALWQIETIGQAMNGLLPEEKRFKTYLRGKPAVMAIIFLAWPMALTIWGFIEMRSNAKLTGGPSGPSG